MGNLKQLGLTMMMYGQDNDGYLPSGLKYNVTWLTILYNGGYKEIYPKAVLCPTQFRRCRNKAKDIMGWANLYAYTRSSEQYIKLDRVKKPSTYYLCGDAIRYFISPAFEYLPIYPFTSSHQISGGTELIPWVHNDGVNVLFFDCHAAWVSRMNQNQVSFLLSSW